MRILRASSTALFGATALACLAAVGAAVATQHFLEMLPCPWCVLQRLIFVAIAAACVIGLVWRGPAGRKFAALLIALLAIAGAASALWQHFVAAASNSCNLTLADRILAGTGLDAALPEVFQPLASCADAAVKLLGIPYEFYSLTLFVIAGIVAWNLFVAPQRRR